MPSIGVVGGGIGGLTAALACLHAGLDDITVYEQVTEPEALGAGIQLSPNATRVLIALGLRGALAQAVFQPEGVHLRTWRTGYLVASRPLGAISEARYGAPYWHVHRGDLHALLLDAARARGIRIETGCRCVSAGEDERGPYVELESGTARHDVIVGADGIRSMVRSTVFQSGAPRFTGHVAWRGMVPAAKLPAGFVLPAATVWLGPGRHFVHYYVRGGELINFVGVVETDRWTEESWSRPGDPAALARDFAGWNPVVTRLIEAADEVFEWALYDHEPLPSWSRGGITLLGDACHPMLPYLAQGAAMAIEDAWVLSRMLERWEDLPAEGLAEYERYRRPRTARVQRESRRQGQEFHLPEGWPALRRNFVLALGSRLLPEIAMGQYDWLHGYDCVRGFD
ncbi:MAG TPA: FAD-dependent monooxygenase [Pseudomonadales bacterium]